MGLDRSWALASVTFNSVTYNGTNGGPQDWDFDLSSNELPSRVADQVFPSAILIPEKDLQVTVSMTDFYQAITPGTKGTLVLTLTTGTGVGTAKTLSFANMVFLHQRGGGQKSVQAQSTLIWRYEGDGTNIITRG